MKDHQQTHHGRHRKQDGGKQRNQRKRKNNRPRNAVVVYQVLLRTRQGQQLWRFCEEKQHRVHAFSALRRFSSGRISVIETIVSAPVATRNLCPLQSTRNSIFFGPSDKRSSMCRTPFTLPTCFFKE